MPIFISSNPSTVHQTYYEMTATVSYHTYPRVSQWLKLIYTVQEKNLTNTPYVWLPEALTYDNRLQSPHFVEIGPLSTGEVLDLDLIPPLTTSLRQGCGSAK
jgi:hypothetical protein